MFNRASLLRGRLDRTLTYEIIAGAAAAIASFFFSLAAYTFLSERYNAIVASLVLGGAYVVLALAALAWLRLFLQKEANQDAAASSAQLLQDPMIMSAGLKVLRAFSSRKAAPLAVLLTGVLIAVSRVNPKSKPSQSGTKAGG